jgi:hypothetical protein
MFGLLRVSKEGELIGLDVDQHGIPAYPEYVISGASASAGKPHDVAGVRHLTPEMGRS